MLEQLKQFSAARADLEEMVALAALARVVTGEFNVRSMPVPEWLTETTNSLDNEISAKVRDELQRRLKKAKTLRETLLTPGERREKLDAEIAALENSLNPAPPQLVPHQHPPQPGPAAAPTEGP